MTVEVEQADPLEVERFLELLRGMPGRYNSKGKLVDVEAPQGELTAAYAVGWTPRKLKALKRDQNFLLLIKDAQERLIESVESVVYRNALTGNQRAIEMVLFSQASDRGWRPPTQRHEVNQVGRIDVTVVASVKEAVRARLENGSIAELQEAEVIDAEVVDDDEDS